jgi:MerR family transcriptional regulator, light-induced transcriptional regulator
MLTFEGFAMTSADNEHALFTIGVLSRLTGISPGTLRIWERRYGIANPARSGATLKRMYTQNDVDRLALVKALVDAGHPVSSLAKLSSDELRSRIHSSADKVATAASASTNPIRVVLLGDTLAIRLAHDEGQVPGIEICGAFRSAAELDDKAKALAADVLLLEYATLQRETLADVWRHLAMTGVHHAVVIFGFGAKRTREELERSGVLCLKAPVSLPEIARACASARGALVQTAGDASERAAVLPPRRFSADQLARIASGTSRIKCECPHHLVDLISSLLAFETYSRECAELFPQDFEIHNLLHTSTASARSLLETSLARIIESEGISVD